jgi:hypothetical protein
VLDTASRSCCTAEFPAGNPATLLLIHGPEALRHCLSTVLPIAVFRRNVPRQVRIVIAIAIEVNRDTTDGTCRLKSGMSCCSQPS